MRGLPSGRLTVLLTDIEGSTPILRRLGSAYAALLSAHYAILRAAARQHGGIEVKTEGDAMLIVFATAHDALAGAADAQRRLAAHTWPAGERVRVRMGLHTGELRILEDDYVGMALHQAARVVTAAHGGQVICSSTTAIEARPGLAAGDCELVPLGSWRLRDFEEPEALFQLTGRGIERDFPALRAVPAAAHNLPQIHASFVGRTSELAELDSLLARHHLVTILGPGGAGKTRTAFELVRQHAESYPDGAVVVLLAAADPASVAAVIAHAIGVRPEPNIDLRETVLASLSRRQALLLLDNCEHVIEEVGDFVAELLNRTAAMSVVTTSRRPLEVASEQTYLLAPLHVPAAGLDASEARDSDAVQLFVERARAADPTLEFDATQILASSEICRRLDGLPLAIELAAPRCRSMSVTELSQRIDDLAVKLSTRTRGVEPRHRTVGAVIDWSVQLLSPVERRMFLAFSVFQGGCDLAAAEALGRRLGIDDVVDVLDALVRDSLIALDADRYRMLVLVRAYAADALRSSPDLEDVAEFHRDYYTRLISEASGHLAGPQQKRWLSMLDREVHNCRIALDRSVSDGLGEAATTATVAMVEYWILRGLAAEGVARCGAVLALAGPQMPVLLALASCNNALADFAAALGNAREALSASDRVGDTAAMAAAHSVLGTVMIRTAELTAAREHLTASRRLHEIVGDRAGVAAANNGLGHLACRAGDAAGAAELFAEQLSIVRELGNRREEGRALSAVATAALELGDLDMALESALAALDIDREAGERSPILLSTVGFMMEASNDVERGKEYLAQAAEAAREMGDRYNEQNAVGNVGDAHWSTGEYDAAEETYSSALRLAREIGAKLAICQWVGCLGDVAWSRGDRLEHAQTLYAEAVDAAHDLPHPSREREYLTALALVAVGRHDLAAAEERLEEAGVIDAGDVSRTLAVAALAAAATSDRAAAERHAIGALTARQAGHTWARLPTLAMVAGALGESGAELGKAVTAVCASTGFVLPVPLRRWSLCSDAMSVDAAVAALL